MLSECLSEIELDPARIARLGQIAEIMWSARLAASWTRSPSPAAAERLTHILCRPGAVMGEVEIPSGCGFVGVNSMVRHSVAANPYSDVRIGAFMGKRIINDIRARKGHDALDYLTEISVTDLKSHYCSEIPDTMLGSKFFARYKTHDDPVTRIQPDATYRVRPNGVHPIEENERVLRFIECPSRGRARQRSSACYRR